MTDNDTEIVKFAKITARDLKLSSAYEKAITSSIQVGIDSTLSICPT